MIQTISCRAAILCATGAASLLTGCASIVNGTTQVVSVETRSKGEPVIGASCKLQNDKGVFYVTTPGTVNVHRAYGDLAVRCEKENFAPGITTVNSRTKPMAFGNILVGGVIGAAVDAGSGAAYDYPPLIRITMVEINSAPGSSSATPAADKKAATAASPEPIKPMLAVAPSSTASARSVERQLTGAQLFDHYADSFTAEGSTSANKNVEFRFMAGGNLEIENKTTGIYGVGTWEIDSADDQICLRISSKQFNAARGCYSVFQKGEKTFELRSGSDSYMLRYSLN